MGKGIVILNFVLWLGKVQRDNILCFWGFVGKGSVMVYYVVRVGNWQCDGIMCVEFW
jgi:hypothetical protein